MIAFRDSRRRQEALLAYGTARAVLIEELGIEPGAELRALQAELLAGDEQSEPSERVTVRGRVSQSLEASPEPDGLADRVPPSVHLPVPRHRLIGREDELAELQGLVRSRPLVTVVGPAGCGKTRLVTEVGGRAGTVFPDGVWFVDLTVATPDRVVDTVSTTIELPVPVDGKTMLALRGFTRGRRMLLILDNCEHVLDAAAELVAELLVDGSELAILATSRELLDVGGEHVLLLQPLPATGEDSPAARLFLERLEAVPGAPSDPRSRSWGAEIAAAVDGLPLAIELAAGRARAYSLAEIVTQVRADASSLSRIGRGGAAHHDTIRNAIDISYQALPDSEAALHRAVAVVPGPFTGVLAAALVTPGPGDLNLDPAQIADAIAGLVHRSLLTPLGPSRPAGASRFAQLATVRGHATHRAAALGEDTRDRRDSWVERLVRSRPPLGSSRLASWYRALDDDLAALRATLQHTLIDEPSALGIALAARLGLYWVFGGLAVEGLGWARTAVTASERDPDLGSLTDRAMVRIAFGDFLTLQNQPDAGREQLRIAISESRGATGADARLLCADLTVATGPVVHVIGDTALLDDLAAAVHALAGGDPELDVLVRHAGLVKSVLEGSPDPGFLDRFFSLYDDARKGDNHYTAWIAAAGAAQVLLVAGQPTEALGWAVKAVEAGLVLGQRENPVTIEIFAYALALIGDQENAVRVFAFAEADHARSGMPWPRTEQTAALLAAATAALDPGTATRARSEGLALTLADLPGLARAGPHRILAAGHFRPPPTGPDG
jgi:predicted ATPase